MGDATIAITKNGLNVKEPNDQANTNLIPKRKKLNQTTDIII